MVNVIIERAPANKQGPDISDPLITSAAVAVERGRNEIDKNCSNREVVTSSGPYQGYIKPGSIVEVADSEETVWRGMVKSCAISISQGDKIEVDTHLVIERVAK